MGKSLCPIGETMTFLCGIHSASPEDDRNKLKIKIIELLVNAVYNCKMSIKA